LSKTAFLGLSHLGINYSIAWSSFGQTVVGFDLDRAQVERLRGGDLPVHEPGLPELLDRSLPWISFSDDPACVAECDLVVIARDVPTDTSNASDLTPVLDLLEAAVPHLPDDVTLAVMSQLPTGFTRRLGQRVAAARPELHFSLFYWVETLVFGDAVRRALHPERIIVGCADPSRGLPGPFATGLESFSCPIFLMGYESAELTKMAINLYLIGSLTYANTMSARASASAAATSSAIWSPCAIWGTAMTWTRGISTPSATTMRSASSGRLVAWPSASSRASRTRPSPCGA
jgi:UDPglucose 6-dehydrogenase